MRKEEEHDTHAGPQNHSRSLRLPLELILEIASYLAGTNAFATLSNLNMTSRALWEMTLPVLYEVVVWDDSRKDFWEFLGREVRGLEGELVVPKGYRHTRVVLMNASERDELSCRGDLFTKPTDGQKPSLTSEETIFPHRTATIIKSPRHCLIGNDNAGNALDDTTYKARTCALEINGRISSEYLHSLLCGLRLRWETSKKNLPSHLLPIQEVSSISLMNSRARIFKNPHLQQSSRFELRQGECSLFTFKLHPDMEADTESRETVEAVYELMNAPRRGDSFRRSALLITNCSLGIYALIIESLPTLLAPQSRSGLTIDVCITQGNSSPSFPELEAAFRQTIEIWRDVWDRNVYTNPNGPLPSGQFHFSVVAMVSAGGKEATYGTIRPLPGGRKGFVAELRTYGSDSWSWKEAVVYPETVSV